MIKDKEKKIYKAKVESIEKVSKTSHYIEIKAQTPIEVKAGQFISIYCNGLTLRRPFSVFFNNDGKVGVLFKERGKGTEFIKSLKAGDDIDFIGPLGNSFEIQDKKSLLIGAGIGVAPIFYLQTKLNEQKIENIFAAGYLNKEEIPFNITAQKTYTDDGSFGEKGSIINYFEQLITEYKPQIIYACGPRIVLKKVCEIAQKHNIETQIAMEKIMACGIGVCRGCVIDVIKDGKVQNATVCKDGPIFKGNEIVW